ncbi:transposase [Salinispora arenicola]|nr:transposase [Salinispora arenicola]
MRVARDREAGVTVEQIAKDFGVHPMTLFTWLRQANVVAGATPGTSSSGSAELREARKRIRLLEQENEVLRRAAAYLSARDSRSCGEPQSSRSSEFVDG